MGILGVATVLLVLGGSNYYIARKLCRFLRHFFPALPGAVAWVICLVSVAVLVLGFARSLLQVSAPVKHALGVANACWMGVFIYLFLFFLLGDAVFLIARLFGAKDAFPFVAAALALALGVCCYGFFHAADVRQKDYHITVSGGEDMTLVLISDVHLGAVGSEKRLAEIVEKINALQPDLVCIAGDFFDSDYTAIADPEGAQALMKSIRATWGVWACLGNHDGGATAADMRAFLQRCGVRVLSDEYALVGDRLVLAGRLDGFPIGGYGGMTRQPLPENPYDPGLPVVVMDHNPAHVEEYGEDFDLILCGHTHRGQLFPGGVITNLLFTVDYGYYRASPTAPQIIVSSGAGTWGMPMRVGTDSEIVAIHIHS